MSPEISIVVDNRILLKVVSRRKPTVCTRWKAAVLGALWQVGPNPTLVSPAANSHVTLYL